MRQQEFTEEMRTELKEKGYVAVVIQVMGQHGVRTGEIASRHRSLYAAQKRADVNQRVETL